MSSREQMIAVVEEYLNCFSTKDTSKIAFADDVTFEGPRMPKLQGRQMVLGFLSSILPMVKGIELKQHIVEGDYVATLFDMETIAGVDHVFDLIHIPDGKIKGIQAFYYPRETPDAQA
ncbi:nuclear transport factor 2 family protein [Terriglobus roseus]|uniref:SnoaL-like domain-containing protein n=1 Tax=Terriglobus roseus TaxID=392734 RepID=A0A1G7PR52_9BACT|nr:nuclear transport factor 2 family protein [Terriglobus roseus]SDF88777.1 SnoaL-like domain-containing protein [Terriglobus roseus]